nr:hypothetical protein [Tanacetum cinerariifolium]
MHTDSLATPSLSETLRHKLNTVSRLRVQIINAANQMEMIDMEVKEKQEKDKIGSKPDKKGKRVEAEKSLKQLQ